MHWQLRTNLYYADMDNTAEGVWFHWKQCKQSEDTYVENICQWIKSINIGVMLNVSVWVLIVSAQKTNGHVPLPSGRCSLTS